MTQYINKASVMEEIEKRIKKYATIDVGDCKELEAIYGAKCKALTEILSFLDTLEVKEVDLEDSVKGIIDYPFIGFDFPNIYPNYKELKDYCDRNNIKDNDKVKIIIIKDVIL